MMDRVTVFGDGVYDAAMGRNGKIFALPEHIDRIFNGMAKLKINPPCSKQEMADTLLEMLGKVDESEVFVYWQVTRGTARRACVRRGHEVEFLDHDLPGQGGSHESRVHSHHA